MIVLYLFSQVTVGRCTGIAKRIEKTSATSATSAFIDHCLGRLCGIIHPHPPCWFTTAGGMESQWCHASFALDRSECTVRCHFPVDRPHGRNADFSFATVRIADLSKIVRDAGVSHVLHGDPRRNSGCSWCNES